MRLEPQISYRDFKATPAIQAKVEERIQHLEHFYPGIMSCRVMLESQHRHHHKGKLFHVRVDVTVGGHELVASRDPKQNQAHEDIYVAIRDAFDAMDRKIEDFARRRRQQVKSHAEPVPGRVSEIEEGHGRIETADGRSIYFHRNSVVDNLFDRLEVGADVRFVEEQGDEGPQASTVRVEPRLA
ncbi:MAG: HPF/RaiA family ribosome-associated protein [Chromatiaceae bacterium]|nr:HPF/RaiA family ribosome-associated protein [Chromatiaceae bacterium]